MKNLAIGTVDFGDFRPSVVSVPVEQGAGPEEAARICATALNGCMPDSIMIVENREDFPIVTNTYLKGKHYG